jgi:hypothetical protein
MGDEPLRPFVASQRPFVPGADRPLSRIGLDLGLFGDLQRVVNIDPEVADSALELAMTE